jgi:hypothetical protein
MLRRQLLKLTALLCVATPLIIGQVAFAPAAFAQHGDDIGNAPPPPPGPGTLTVALIGDTDTAPIAGIPIALYALGPDGTPGLANGETDATGTFTFTGISNNPEIVYLLGARYADIPFGERISFEADSTTARVEILVSQPTTKIAGVSVEEIRVRVDWMGDRIIVTETLRLNSAGERVIQVGPTETGPAIVQRRLPSDASDFNAGPSSIGDDLAKVGSDVRFYGPLYPGEQRIEYQYSLPVSRDTDALRFPVSLRQSSDRIVIVAGTSGIQVSGSDLTPSIERTSESGQQLEAWERRGLRAGETFEVGIVLPETRIDPSALSIPRTDVWIDLDDTRLDANVDLQLLVEPGAPISGTALAPLMHITIPTGASLEGVAPEAESMGLVPTEDGGFDVVGPIGPGEHSLAYSYRVPSHPDGIALDMRFPREVQTLNVLIADVGLALDSKRLHRRRPFRNRTRNYLHREAYNVGMNEVVDLTLSPLRAAGLPQSASIGLTIAAAAGAALFLVAPLRGRRRVKVATDPELERIREKRESVYTAIADLEHDFETGKLEEVDYAAMREELKAQAIELIKSERSAAGPVAGAATKQKTTKSAASQEAPTDSSSSNTPSTGAFCPSCGGRLDARWRFCSHCGGELQPTDVGAGAENDG